MGIEEKAKAYEMALEAARKELGVDRKEWKVVQRVLHNIFSELRESNEEEIRKDIIGGLMWQRDNLKSEGPHDNNLILPGFCLSVGKHLAYLEKQKEQKPVVTHGEPYLVDTLGTQQEIAGKMPQKPAEWSEEDKSFYDSIMCEVVKEGMHPTPEQANWFKSLPERFNLQSI